MSYLVLGSPGTFEASVLAEFARFPTRHVGRGNRVASSPDRCHIPVIKLQLFNRRQLPVH